MSENKDAETKKTEQDALENEAIEGLKKMGVGGKILLGIERVGNKIPDPVMIFSVLCVILLILSAIFSGVAVVHPGTGDDVVVNNLLTVPMMQRLLINVPSSFLGFAPLGAVLTIMLGCGVAEKSGWLVALVRSVGSKTSARTVTILVMFIGMMSNQAGDAGWIVLPPLAAMLFQAVGRNPLVGMIAAYSGVSTGMAANLLPSMSDVLAGTFTIQAAQGLDPSYTGNIAMNYYFMLASFFLLWGLNVWVTEKITTPRMGAYDPSKGNGLLVDSSQPLSAHEKKSLSLANYTFLGLGVILIVLCIGENAFMRGSTGSLITSDAPLMNGIVTIVTIMFLIPGIVYGIRSKTLVGSRGVVAAMADSMRDMSGYIVMAFMASQFTAWFAASNLSVVLAVSGADFLKGLGIGGLGLCLGLIVITIVIDMFIGSASAKWAIFAPVFVPMLMLMGVNPALSQLAYRIGDSVTNVISPLFPYMMVLLAYCRKYDKNFGYGTMFVNMIPFSLVMGGAWVIFFIIWYFTGLPLGPQGPLTYAIGG